MLCFALRLASFMTNIMMPSTRQIACHVITIKYFCTKGEILTLYVI